MDDGSSLLERLADPSVRLRSQESTVEMIWVQTQIASDPAAPDKLEFSGACGATLIATAAIYDQHLRCAMRQTVLLVSLVYDTDRRRYEIVPFRIHPESGP